MTDKEIIKALECCISSSHCKECPYQKILCCSIERDALDLINRQQAEIERLKALCEAKDKYIERLRENFARFNRIEGRHETKTAIAIKLFAEKAKNGLCGITNFKNECDCSKACNLINNLVKEMTEGQK